MPMLPIHFLKLLLAFLSQSVVPPFRFPLSVPSHNRAFVQRTETPPSRSGTGADLRNTTPAVLFPGDPGDPVLDWPEGYDAARWGASGNLSIDGTLTFGASVSEKSVPAFMRRGEHGARNAGDPPYAIHNGGGDLAERTVAPNATHANGDVEYDVHNLFGCVFLAKSRVCVHSGAGE
jgi:hypothetical protein